MRALAIVAPLTASAQTGCFDKGIASGLVDVGGELHRVEFTAR